VIDSHCHLDVAAFDRDRGEVIARALGAGVTGVLVPAIRPRTWCGLRADGIVRVAIGIHPQIVPELAADERCDQAALERAAHDAAAIGECGLDGATAEPERQLAIFRAHIRAARALGKPLVLHVLRAHDVAPRILREERAYEVGGVLHSYSGGAALVPVYRDLGLAFSFAGPITYANARRPIEAARAIPEDLLLAETDAPDQAPAAFRGQRSEPAMLRHVIDGLARARDAEPAAIAALTRANAERLFGPWPTLGA